MAGEPLEHADLTPLGVAGDRLVQVYDATERVLTARSHPALLGFRATLGPEGEPLVDGTPWADPAVARMVGERVGREVTLSREADPHLRFDVLPLLVATDGAITAFGRDGRRLRPNLVIGGVPGLDERGWPGGELVIGDAMIGLDSLRGRCVMTTFDPDTLAQDPTVLRDIVHRFGGRLALNAAVLRGGPVEVGQEVLFRAASGPVSHPPAVGISTGHDLTPHRSVP